MQRILVVSSHELINLAQDTPAVMLSQHEGNCTCHKNSSLPHRAASAPKEEKGVEKEVEVEVEEEEEVEG